VRGPPLLGRWLRAGREREDLDFQRLAITVLSTPIPEPSACAACGAADTGARAGLPPLPGAGSTPEHPAPAFSQPAQRAPGT